MKKFLLTGLMAIAILSSYSQQNLQSFKVDDMVALHISGNGQYVIGQDIYGAGVLVVNTRNQALTYYEALCPGNFNCIADNGTAVGQDLQTSLGAIMSNGNFNIPKALENNGSSSIDAITADASRVCGYTGNAASETYAVPFYMDLDANNDGELKLLPIPDKDFIGNAPQFVTACTISDDGKTIAGFVQDGVGMYAYPIVFKQGSDSSWEYFTPSLPLFNPNNLPVPLWPADMPGESQDSYYKKIDQYWADMAKLCYGSNFALNQMRLSPDGNTLVACLAYAEDDDDMTDEFSSLSLCVFNLTDMSYKIVSSKYMMLIPLQVLSDKSILCIDTNSYSVYVATPGYDKIITLEEYLQSQNPNAVAWMTENLGMVDVITTEGVEKQLCAGILGFSNDMSVMSGGYIGEAGVFTYVLQGLNAGVESIVAENNEGKWVVYDLLGNKLLETTNPDSLSSLKKGLYIINGKKIFVK